MAKTSTKTTTAATTDESRERPVATRMEEALVAPDPTVNATTDETSKKSQQEQFDAADGAAARAVSGL